jgi:hypothetical protein
MSKRLTISFIPLLATAMFAVMPAVAQAAQTNSPIVTEVKCTTPCNSPEAGTTVEGPVAGKTAIKIVGHFFGEGHTGEMAVGPPTLPTGLEVTGLAVVSESEMTAETKGQASGPYKLEVIDLTASCTPSPACKTNGAQSLEGFPTPTFTYGPQVTSISPVRGPVSAKTKLTIKGTGLRKAGTTFKAGAISLTAVVVTNENEATAELPCGAAAGPLEVNATTTAGTTGTSKSGRQFVCESAAKIPHYYLGSNSAAGREAASGGHKGVIAWGTLSLTNVKGGSGGKVTCHNVVGGWVENPTGEEKGPAGIGETQSFNPYECESKACTSAATETGPATYISVLSEPTPFTSPSEPGGTASNLAWKSVLVFEESSGLTRGETIYAKVNVICHLEVGANPETGKPIFANLEEVSEGANRPSSGPTKLAILPVPPSTIFDAVGEVTGDNAGSGELHGPGSEAGRTGKTEGELHVVGYAENELLNTKVN